MVNTNRRYTVRAILPLTIWYSKRLKLSLSICSRFVIHSSTESSTVKCNPDPKDSIGGSVVHTEQPADPITQSPPAYEAASADDPVAATTDATPVNNANNYLQPFPNSNSLATNTHPKQLPVFARSSVQFGGSANSLSSPNYMNRNYCKGGAELFIKGPICVCQGAWCCEQDFTVVASDGKSEIGKISKKFSGLIKEYFTDADNFGVQFPLDLEVKMKAAMVGAVFLIDFMYFENESNNRNS
ncbi:uncharacterized protein LOC142344285 [Convolutriloba macropyga]|uniref:uncharacterized protein LOC142344285 n=1 Tax=Convolutriloba macropyga TaxID=536237 RepID=UPI003F525664